MPTRKPLNTHLLFYIAILHSILIQAENSSRLFTIMFEPAGDSRYPGRIIGNAFEKTITLECAREIKHKIESECGNAVKVILSRIPGERTNGPLANAQFANRLNIDLYVSINIFVKEAEQSEVFIFYYARNMTTDFWPNTSNSNNTYFVPHTYAYKKNIIHNRVYSTFFYNAMNELSEYRFSIETPIALPFRPLQGILSPALALEIQVSDAQDYKKYISAIAHSCIKLMNHMNSHA